MWRAGEVISVALTDSSCQLTDVTTLRPTIILGQNLVTINDYPIIIIFLRINRYATVA